MMAYCRGTLNEKSVSVVHTQPIEGHTHVNFTFSLGLERQDPKEEMER